MAENTAGKSNRRKAAQQPNMDQMFDAAEARERLLQFVETYLTELIGACCLLFAFIGLLSILFADPSWLVVMVGWTAIPLILTILTLGIVLLLKERAGYWSVEALIGAELLLLSMQASSFTSRHDSVNWQPVLNGQEGGLVGWGIGSLLVAALGQSPAGFLLFLIGLAGVAMLIRYTPLYYIIHLLIHFFPILKMLDNLISPYLPSPIPNTSDLQRQAEPPTEGPIIRAHGHVYGAGDQEPVTTPAVVQPQAAANPAVTTEPSQAQAQESKPKRRNTRKKADADQAASSQKKSQPAQAKAQTKAQTNKKQSSNKKSPSRLMRRPEALPDLSLLTPDSGEYGSLDVDWMSEMIVDTLGDFDVPVKIVHVQSGPTVTQFGIEPQFLERAGQKRKIRVSKIVSLADDLSLALAASSVRIEAPVPGRPYVGIEVPNTTKSFVNLHGIMDSPELKKSKYDLALPLGRDTAGKPVVMDLARAPHMLIAGATGAGKSVGINTIVTGLLMQHGPESLNFVMVDPKMVELPGYNGIPHLLGPVITDMSHVQGMLTWLLLQMDDRYKLFRDEGVRNLESYNELMLKRKKGKKKQEKFDDGDLIGASQLPRNEPLPFLVLIVDELADLMMTAPEDIETQICRLAQKARATGIHLILATQRPSTDVVTGLIKANFPTRIAFAVTSQIDSRVILDTPGAERLLGRGDMLLMRSDQSKLFRVQGCFAPDEDIKNVVDYWRVEAAQAQSIGDSAGNQEQPQLRHKTVAPWIGLMDRMDDDEELLYDAIDAIRDLDSCSTSLLQRKLGLGYPKAASLMEALEAKKIVGPDRGGGRGRLVLLKRDESDEQDE